MSAVLWMLLVQGAMGTFDTLYYHEHRARLPARPEARVELRLHAARDFIYSLVFGSLPWIAFHGAWGVVLIVLLAAEIAITLTDFVVEDTVRRPQGGVFAGERVTHALMAILYGAVLAYLVPQIWRWIAEPTALVVSPVDAPPLVGVVLGGMAVGVGVSGVRDLLASLGVEAARWPWRPVGAP